MATTAIVTPRTKLDGLANLIAGAKQRLSATLAGAIDARQFATAAMQCCRRNPRLLDCNPTSFLTALLEGAQLALMIGDGAAAEAHLVPYKNEVKLIPGYRGLLKLAYQHARVGTINANVVHEKDAYRYQAAPPTIEHTPSPNPNRGEMVAAYMQCWLTGSTVPINFWLWRHQIEAIRDNAPGAKRTDSPWNTHPESMWVKTVIRHGCKYIPRSATLMAAVDRPDPDVDSTEPATGAELSPIDFPWSDEPTPFDPDRVASDGNAQPTTPVARPSTDKHSELRAKVRDLAADIGNDRAEQVLGAVGVDGLREITAASVEILEAAVKALQEEKMHQLADRPKAGKSAAGKQPELIPGNREVNP